jgi:hypothetical protein
VGNRKGQLLRFLPARRCARAASRAEPRGRVAKNGGDDRAKEARAKLEALFKKKPDDG